MLLLELAFTRVLSVSLWYHFGFLVISTALLGFGVAGVTLTLWRKGCAAIAIVMPTVGGSGSIFVAAACGFFAAACFGFPQARLIAAGAMLLGVGVGLLAPWGNNLIPISITSNKSGSRAPAPLYSAWNTISRVNVYSARPGSAPQRVAPGTRAIEIDGGTAMTGMEPLKPGVRQFLASHTSDSDYESGIAYLNKSHPKLLIIGSGGGRQVLDGLHFGASSITAVEINPIINEVVSRRMADFWGGLFAQPEVHLVTGEGRSFIRRSTERYDAIVSVHTISNAAVASGALSLAENYVLTREAFADYLDHLTPDGVLYFTRPETQIARLFATARETFDRRNYGQVAPHLFAYREAPPATGPRAGKPVFSAGFLLKQSAWTAGEIGAIERLLNPPSSRNPEYQILFSPTNPDKNSLYHAIATTTGLPALYAAHGAQLRPATDDRPFFNQHARWSSLGWHTVGDVFRQQQMGRRALEDLPVAEITLLAILAQSVILAAVLILLPLVRRSGVDLPVGQIWRFLIYFAGLGAGFIFIEIALLQRFTLFLGEPVYTLAAVLASLLLFTGIGSAIAQRFQSEPAHALRWSIPVLIAVLAITGSLSPIAFGIALGLPLPLRILLSITLIAPLAMALGMPFPLGLRLAASRSDWLVPLAWGVNAFFTVIGSVLALILGMALGFRMVLMLASLCYLSSWLTLRWETNRTLSSAGMVATHS